MIRITTACYKPSERIPQPPFDKTVGAAMARLLSFDLNTRDGGIIHDNSTSIASISYNFGVRDVSSYEGPESEIQMMIDAAYAFYGMEGRAGFQRFIPNCWYTPITTGMADAELTMKVAMLAAFGITDSVTVGSTLRSELDLNDLGAALDLMRDYQVSLADAVAMAA